MAWEVIAGIVAVIGCLATLGTMVWKLGSIIVEATTELKNLVKGLDEFKIRYTDNLKYLQHTDEHLQEQINDHEHRITVLEEHK
jgi:hypothetical protein